FKCVHIPFDDWKMAKDEDVKWFDTAGAYNEFPPEIVPPSIPLKSSKILAETAFKEQYEKNHEAEVIDQLNVTYVAFTRAVDELIVNYYNTENLNSVGGLITQAIAMADNAYCEVSMARLGGLPAESRNVFIPLRESVVDGNLIIGEPTQYVPIQEDEQEAVITMPAYSTVERDDIWNLSRVEELQDIDKPRDRGVILHDVLSRVKHGRDVPLAVRRHAYKLLLPEPEILEITEFLSNAVKAPEVTRWFENYRMIVRERTIITQSGERYRPDRVVWTEDGTVEVVDYKFGEPHPRRYAEQVRGYMALLQNIGYDKVKGFIWYLDSGKIVEVSK
ncbi:MAG: PD-(D/E)XK nuclease family protein, partial [Muribaculaceae bacterium]|nr:PD-(D/E)XK nuclease family protein [Muribaculaceae bacterium]